MAIVLIAFNPLPANAQAAENGVSADMAADESASYQLASAPQEDNLSRSDKMFLARQFVTRMKQGFSKAKTSLKKAGFVAAGDDAEGLPEGEHLLFNIRLDRGLRLDTPLLGRVYDGRVALSLRDFMLAVDFPIEYKPEAGTFEGWYIRENKLFALDINSRAVSSDHGSFELSDTARAEDDDLFVPVMELAQWFGFTMTMDVSRLDILLESPVKLPIQERLAREKQGVGGRSVGPPQLPELVDEPGLAGFPAIDVATNSRYFKPGNGADVQNSHRATVRTVGDFAGGTLSTHSQLEREENLTNLRINYKQESLNPELLGPMKARRFEVGDVTLVNQPLDTFSSLGTGARVTNIHPLRSILKPSTEITGEAFPGWEVELYRNNHLVGYQVVGDDGFYRFEDVTLYSSDNTFRVVTYGPQGEQREEEIYVPVDPRRLSEMGAAYDISINRQNDITYRKTDSEDEDTGALAVSAQYEMPIGDVTALATGFESGSRDGERINIAHAGVSTTIAETLLNLNTAAEHTGEMAAELVARRNIGNHEFRNDLSVQTDKYGVGEGSDGGQVFGEQFSVTGPLDLDVGILNPRYNFTVDYGQNADGDKAVTTTGGISGAIGRMALNQQFTHTMNDNAPDDELHSLTTLIGSWGANRIRLSSDYEITPDSNLDFVSANVRRYVDEDVELDVTLSHRTEPRLTEGRAQVNWWAGFAHLSPGIVYNSDNDLALTLNTRFGLTKDPNSGDIRMFDRHITNNGGISAFVFLDENGDGVFNEGEEPLPEVIVRAPQNSGREVTDDEGYAFFNRLAPMRLTDVFVDPESLKDPFWISANEGSAILPRDGHVTSLQFPVHISGEIDGSVYARSRDGDTRPLRGIVVSLYNIAGQKIMSAVSEADGFYLLSRIPPGEYYLNVDTPASNPLLTRPAPRPVSIGYEGTTIYAQNIYMEEASGDVGYNILASADAIAPNPAALEGKSFILNLGEYSSRLMMGLSWYKLRTMYGNILAGTDLLERPSQSFVNDDGKHILRVIIRSNTIEEAQRRCRSLVARGQACTVEILPGGLPQQVSTASPEKQG